MTQRDTEALTSSEPPAPASAGNRSHRRRWIVTAVVATVVILAGVSVVGYAVSARSDQQSRRHFITVLLDPEVTAAQRAAVEKELAGWNPTVGPEFKSSGDLASAAGEMYQDNPEALARAADMVLPAMIVLTVESPAFDCEPVPALLELPGVRDITIEGVTESGGGLRRITCP